MSTSEERLARVGLALTVGPCTPDAYRAIRAAGPVAAWHGYTARHPAPDPADALRIAQEAGWRPICPGDDEWPTGLSGLDVDGELRAGAVLALWARGPAHLATVTAPGAVAVVGSRVASGYGLHVAGELGGGLADRGRTVIAAAAHGIDTAALTAAARVAPAVVVLASTDELHRHRALLDTVGERGVVVTASVPGQPLSRRRLAARHRLIAGLASGVVLVETARGGKSLAATSAATALGRPVMVVPGPVTSGVSGGCHELLRTNKTARLVTCVEHICTELDTAPTPASVTAPSPGPRPLAPPGDRESPRR
ncbi:DNA-processing protein DprA [Pseudofrankia saprophytica]|uniref:DNA-processing protein DprA n=1 Tax=Pseudofrankia saprophytica TaxID=298655 RepID=UPI000234BE91|nr:DNA-processing protein DprA [Pseudofrankia saprophytica]